MHLTVRLSGIEPPVRVGGRGLAWRLTLASLAGTAAAVASWWPFWGTEAATGLVNTLVTATFVASAVVMLSDREQRRTGIDILCSAAFFLTSWWWAWPPSWQVGPLPLVSFTLGYLWFVLGGMALARYPAARLARRYERVAFIALAIWICGGKAVLAVLGQPEWAGFRPGAWWPPSIADRSLYDIGTTVFNTVLVGFTIMMLALLLAKARRARGNDAFDAVPAVVAAAAVAVCGAVYLTARVSDMSPELQGQLRIVTAIAALSAPIAFLSAVLRRRLITESGALFGRRIAGTAAIGRIETELRRTLGDGTRLLIWDDSAGAFRSAEGAPAREPDDPTVHTVRIDATDESPLALVETAPSLRRQRLLVESVAHAVGMALEQERTRRELFASRARISETELDARRRFGRELHDGLPQHVHAAKLHLMAARTSVSEDAAVAEALDQVRTELNATLDAIRDLSRSGEVPSPLLRAGGLADAVQAEVRRLSIAADLAIAPRRWAERQEEMVYAFARVALTNVHLYARGSAVRMAVDEHGGELVATISDDGPGGADPTRGTGLTGIRDRVHALGGRFTLSSPDGGGTLIEVTLPCGS